MLWEPFRSHALALLGEHFPPELIEDNGDSSLSAQCAYFKCARAIAEAYGLQYPQAQTSQPRC